MQEPLPLCQAYKPQSIVEHNQDRLTLALEPECATAHCREAGGFREEENYILVDIGGGTVDIVSHAIVAGDLEEIIPPQGDDCGGTKINENFRDFLGCVLGDPKFFRFIGQHIPEDIRIRNERELDDLVYEEFEDHKCDFGTYYKSGQDNYNIKLRPYLWDCYKDVIKKKGEESISFDMAAHEMILSPSKMAELFEPTIRSIIAIVNKVLKEVGHIAENIYLAGGFGGSLYLKSKLEEALILQPMLYRFQLHPAPGESELGVVHGAVMFRCDPSLIHKRKSDNTYGIGVSVSFQQDVHDETKKFWNEDQQEYKCDDIFCTIVEKGDSISSESVYVKELNTGRKDTKLITIRIYSSPKKNVFYTTDDEVQRLGHFEVNVAGYGAYRKVEVAVDFTHCEIQLRAYDKQDPSNEVKLALDFLCNK